MKTTINIRINSRLKDDLEIIADENNQSISKLLREIIYEYTDDYFSEELEDIVIECNPTSTNKYFDHE